MKNVFISSYNPINRTAPPPIDLMRSNFSFESIGIDIQHDRFRDRMGLLHELDTSYTRSIYAAFLHKHPDYLQYDDSTYRRAYATYYVKRWREQAASSVSAMIPGITLGEEQPPDHLLRFPYRMAVFRVDADAVLEAVNQNTSQFIGFLSKRYNNLHYRFAHKRIYLNKAFWKNTDNWTGFHAGLLADWVMTFYRGSEMARQGMRCPPYGSLANATVLSSLHLTDACSRAFNSIELQRALQIQQDSFTYHDRSSVYSGNLKEELEVIVLEAIEKEEHASRSTQGQAGPLLQDIIMQGDNHGVAITPGDSHGYITDPADFVATLGRNSVTIGRYDPH